MTLEELAKEEAEKMRFPDLFISDLERQLYLAIFTSELRLETISRQIREIDSLKLWLVGSLLANVILIVYLILSGVA